MDGKARVWGEVKQRKEIKLGACVRVCVDVCVCVCALRKCVRV